MNKTVIAIAVTGLLAIAGCSASVDQSPAETPTSVPTVTETASESMTDLLLPPSATTTLEPIEGLLPPVTSDQSPQFIWEQVDLPEVENLPPLPAN